MNSKEKSSSKSISWLLWPVLMFAAIVFFIWIMVSLLQASTQTACSRGDFSLCALENVVGKIWEDGDCSDIALQNLGIAQMEFVKDRQLRIRDDTEVQFLGVPTLEELREWCAVLKYEYRYSNMMLTQTRPNGEVHLTLFSERAAILSGPVLHVYTSGGVFAESRAIHDCSGKIFLANQIEWAFKCPISRVIVHTDLQRDGVMSLRTYDALGFALHDWQPVPSTDLVAPEPSS